MYWKPGGFLIISALPTPESLPSVGGNLVLSKDVKFAKEGRCSNFFLLAEFQEPMVAHRNLCAEMGKKNMDSHHILEFANVLEKSGKKSSLGGSKGSKSSNAKGGKGTDDYYYKRGKGKDD